MNCIYIELKSKLREVIQYLCDLCKEKPQVFGFDTETTGLDCHTAKLRLIQVSYKDTVYLIDCFKVENYKELFSTFLEAVRQSGSCLVGHNLKFEIKMCWANGIELTGCKLFDTMLATNLLDAGLSDLTHSLEAITERYLHIKLDKTEQKSNWGGELTKEQLEYAAMDAVIVVKLFHTLRKCLYDANLETVFYQLEMRVLFCTAVMEYYGAKLSLERLEALRPFYEEQERVLTEQFLSYAPNRFIRYDLLGKLIDPGISITSNKQVLQVLQELKIPDPFEEYDVIQSTGADAIKLLDWNDYPVLEALGKHRGVSKLLSSYIYSLPNLVNPFTGRLHTEYRQMVSTGRYSSSNPNQQQIPRPVPGKPSIRSCFVPEEGYVLISSDFSQIELRVMAEVSGDENMLDEFISGKDPYASTAAYINNISYEQMFEWKKAGDSRYKSYRQKAKPVRLGYNYSMGYKKFRLYARQQYGQSFTEAEAKAVRDSYFNAYPKLTKYHQRFGDKGITEVRTLAPFYRRRLWYEYAGIPGMCNFPIQGCLKYTTRVLTSIGYLQIGELAQLDTTALKVWDGNSWYSFICLNRGEARLAQITLTNNKVLDCDVRHEVLVATESGYEFVKFIDLKEGDLICNSMASVLEYGDYDGDTELFYWLGFYLGNGSCQWDDGKISKKYKAVLSFTFGSVQHGVESDLVSNRVSRCLKYFSQFGYAYVAKEYDGKQRKEVIIHSRKFVRAWLEAYPEGSNYYTKKIPEFVWRSRLETRKSFLQGVLDSDGYISEKLNIANIHLANEKVIHDLYLLARTLGVTGSIVETVKDRSWRLNMSPGYTSKYLERGKSIEEDRLIINRSTVKTPKFVLDDFILNLSALKAQLTSSERAILSNARKGKNVHVYTIRQLYKKYRVTSSIDLFEYIPVKSKVVLDSIEETYTLSVFNDKHWFDSEGFISKNTSGDIQKLAMANLYFKLFEQGYSPLQSQNKKLIMTIHDEIGGECIEDLGEEFRIEIGQEMVKAGEFVIKKCPIEAEGKIMTDLSQKD